MTADAASERKLLLLQNRKRWWRIEIHETASGTNC